jgi:hypothetical protein
MPPRDSDGSSVQLAEALAEHCALLVSAKSNGGTRRVIHRIIQGILDRGVTVDLVIPSGLSACPDVERLERCSVHCIQVAGRIVRLCISENFNFNPEQSNFCDYCACIRRPKYFQRQLALNDPH